LFGRITGRDLTAPAASVTATPRVPLVTPPIGRSLTAVEGEMIIRTLEYTGQNKKRTTEILGISRRALCNKINKPGLSV